MDILERFLNYVRIPTTSCSKSDATPSTKEQFDLANVLFKELEDLGLDVYFDREHCYLYGVLRGNVVTPSVGFISHMDTSEDAYGLGINPQIRKNYQGEAIELENKVRLDIEQYPDLKKHIGKTLITSDGKTLLGADDKAGIAEIMNMLEYFVISNDSHGDIWVAFTPDEEIG